MTSRLGLETKKPLKPGPPSSSVLSLMKLVFSLNGKHLHVLVQDGSQLGALGLLLIYEGSHLFMGTFLRERLSLLH